MNALPPSLVAVAENVAHEAVRAGMWFADGARRVMGTGAQARHEVAAAEAGGIVRQLVAEGAPGVFFSAGFDPDTPTLLIVPDALVIEEDSVWDLGDGVGPYRANRLAVSISASADRWSTDVAEASATIRDASSALEKVVLAREIRVRADAPVDPRMVLARLAGTFPTAYLYSIGGLVGASPELLGQVLDGMFQARALAGTAGRDADPHRDSEAAAALLRSAKDRHEHRLLQAFLGERLPSVVDDLHYRPEPELLTLTNVHHLLTVFDGRVNRSCSGPGGLIDLVTAIHPTPAIAGVPQSDALEWIRAHEPPRGRLGGFVGWNDREGNGQAVLAIRSLEIEGSGVRLVVGNGIVGESDPAAEVSENQAKARGVLDAVTSL